MNNGVNKNSFQTSVRHDRWLKWIVEAAKRYVPSAKGMGISVQNFFIMATGAYATKVLKDVGAYEREKAFFVKKFGPVSDFDETIIGGDSVVSAEEENNPLLDNVENGEQAVEKG